MPRKPRATSGVWRCRCATMSRGSTWRIPEGDSAPDEPPLEEIASRLVVGDADTCAEKLVTEISALLPVHISCFMGLPAMPQARTLQSMERFGSEVMPKPRAAFRRAHAYRPSKVRSRPWMLGRGYASLLIPPGLYLAVFFVWPLLRVVLRSVLEPQIGLQNYAKVLFAGRICRSCSTRWKSQASSRPCAC